MAYIPDPWVTGGLSIAQSAREILFYYCARADQDTGRTIVSPEKTSQDLGIRKDHVSENDCRLIREGLIVITRDDNGGRVIQLAHPWQSREERQKSALNGARKQGSQVMGSAPQRRPKRKSIRKRSSQDLGTTQDLGNSTQILGSSTQDLGKSPQDLGNSTQDLGNSTQDLGLHIRNNQPINQPNDQPINHGTGADAPGADAPAESITKERCYDLFVEHFRTVGGYEAPYDSKKDADFTQTQKLIKTCQQNNWPLTERKFLLALQNYLTTPQGSHTLADLAGRFSSFFKGALDRYSKPVDAPTKQSLSERNKAAVEEAMRRRGLKPASELNVIDIKSRRV